MKLATRTRYGLRAAIELAKNYGNGPLQIKLIGKNQGISVKYLEQIIAMLKNGGIVRSLRGARGGYVLAREPEKIGLDEIVLALEGSISTVECVENESLCARAADCVARQVWTKVQDAMIDVLKSMTLKDMVDKAQNHNKLTYQI
ncbi:MAG: Rrf2 family transcriptional regulator [Sedimentisphaerales bacterium]|nr:Rrf2 family transcriptional regulator [Sedimentisphaerales bacterium]